MHDHTARYRSIAALSIAVVAVGASLTACSGNTSGSPAGADGGGATIGISYPFMNVSTFVAESQLVEAGAEAAGLTPLAITDAQADTSKQIADIQSLVARGAEGLIVVANDSDAVIPAVEAAKAEGVPTVGLDLPTNSPDVAINVRVDNTSMGVTQCEEVAKAVEPGDTIYYQAGNLSDGAGGDRWDGFSSCMESEHPDIEVIMQEGKWDTALATSQLETVLTQTPDIKAIVMASDAVYVTPVLAVLRQRGLDAKVGEPGHIYLSGIDGAPEALQAIRDGYQDLTLSQPFPDYATYAVEYLQRAMAGETFEPGPTEHGSEIVEDDNGVLTDFLSPILVTIDNVDSDDAWANVVDL